MKDKPAQKGKGGGKGRGKGKNSSKGGKSSAHDTKGPHLFDEFQQKHKNTLWHEKANDNPGICWRFQVRTQRIATENTCASAALVGGFRTTTVCVSKQRSERPLLLNFVVLVQIPFVGVLPGSVFWSRFLVFFFGISLDTLGVGRVRDSSASASEVLKAESSANLSCEGESHRTSELSSYEMAHAGGADGQTWSTSSATLWLESAFFLVPFLACRPLAAYAVRRGIMASFTTFSDAAKAAAPQLEPTLEAALRKYDVHEDIITGFRCNRIKSQAVFVALNRTVEGLADTLKEAFGVDPSKAFAHKRELAQHIAAWEESKIPV